MVELEEGAYYMVPEKRDHRVVRVRSLDERHVVVVEAEGAAQWTLNRGGFEERLHDGYIQEVTPRWEPAGEGVTA